MLFYMVIPGTPAEPVQQTDIDEGVFPRIGQGDPAALEELFNSTERVLYAFVLSIVKNPDDTADIVQDVYIKIRESAHLYQPRGKPLAWMFTIARHLAINHLRFQGRQAWDEMNQMENDMQFSYITDPTDRIVLGSALNILKEEERQILLLHVLSGLKHREIAAGLSLPLATVLSRYNRSLKKLREHLIRQGVSE